MKYDFDKVIDRRHTNSVKWDENDKIFGREDVLPMWVADMDFKCAKPIADAIINRAYHPIYGYGFAPETAYEAVINKVKRSYGWEIKKEWIVFCDGVVSGVYSAVKSYTNPGDEVIIQTPVYHPFKSAILDNECSVVENKLSFNNNRYTMDFEDLKAKFTNGNNKLNKSKAKAIILCSPHNPVGRVWTKEELLELGNICIKNNCIVISDEIHCDIVYKNNSHTSFAAISESFAENSITFIAPSKTYNVAGLNQSVAIIPNKRLRDLFVHSRQGQNWGNIFGITALEAAYNFGDEYLQQLLNYLQSNIAFFCDFVNERIPRINVVKPEGTYLLWVDMRNLGFSDKELEKFIVNDAKLGLNNGNMFGSGGEGFQRFNIACPRSYLEKALISLEKCVNKIK